MSGGNPEQYDRRRFVPWPEESASPDEQDLHSFVGHYHEEKARRAGTLPSTNEATFDAGTGEYLGHEARGPNIDIDLPSIRQLLIDRWGIDPDDYDPPAWLGIQNDQE